MGTPLGGGALQYGLTTGARWARTKGTALGYHLGIDLGTTYSSAAIHRDGRVESVLLGHGSTTVPTAVWVGPAGERLVGDAALRRGMIEPDRLAREFKRRLGDDVPLVLGGAPVSADQLMTTMLQWILERVVAEQGSAPASVAVTHPANWGSFRREIFANAVHAAGVADPILLSEPEAAALHYADTGRVRDGEVVAVYDLGGGTFDIALLRRTGTAFEFIGTPDGVERLGGIDFDTVVVDHVRSVVGGLPAPTDDESRSALMRLRQECTEAKEALSADSEVHIQVSLPDRHEVVRLNRSEFEAMIRPAVLTTVDAVRRVLASVSLTTDDIAKVLLVGGSSRIPLVAELLGGELGRDVAVDTHPKMAVAMGAAVRAAAAAPPTPVVEPPPSIGPTPSLLGADAPKGAKKGLLVAAAVVVAVAVVGAVVLLGGDDESTVTESTVAPETTVAVVTTEPVTTTVPETTAPAPPAEPVTSLQLDQRPEGVVARFGKVWVGTTDGVLHSFDPLTGEELKATPLDDSIDDLVATDDAIWVSSQGRVHRIDPDTGDLVFTSVVGGDPEGLAASGDRVVVAVNTPDGGLVQLIDPSSNVVTDLAAVPGEVNEAAAVGDVVWVGGGQSLHRVAADGTVLTITLEGVLDGLTTDGDAVWVSIPTADVILELDPVTGEERSRLAVTGPGELLIDGDTLWTTRPAADVADGLDRTSGSSITSVATGATPDRMSIDEGRIWISNIGDNTITAATLDGR